MFAASFVDSAVVLTDHRRNAHSMGELAALMPSWLPAPAEAVVNERYHRAVMHGAVDDPVTEIVNAESGSVLPSQSTFVQEPMPIGSMLVWRHARIDQSGCAAAQPAVPVHSHLAEVYVGTDDVTAQFPCADAGIAPAADAVATAMPSSRSRRPAGVTTPPRARCCGRRR